MRVCAEGNSIASKLVLLFATLLAGAALPARGDLAQVSVAGGLVQGVVKNGVTSFKGIPFAAPPVGDSRWRAPQPVVPWTGVRHADAYAAAPMQPAGIAFLTGAPRVSEDCLYLNVWTPAKSADERLPVMVWIYGGAFSLGSTSTPTYDGANLARHGVVMVSVAYRLGAFGFLADPQLSAESGHGSGCYGIQDQIAGLRWVKENIAHFGGDPSRVTVFGESAGGESVSILSASPAASGLYQRAICESGGIMAAPKRDKRDVTSLVWALGPAQQRGTKFLASLGATDLKSARALTAEQIQDATSVLDFTPVADGQTIVGDPYTRFAAGQFNDTPILVGTNSDDGGMFAPSTSTPAEFEQEIRSHFGPAADQILNAYPHATTDEASAASRHAVRDAIFAWPTWAWASLQSKLGRNKAFVYYFDRRTPRTPNGSRHGAELQYVFHNLGGWMNESSEDDVALADLISSYWTNFAKTGDPNGPGLPAWPTFDEQSTSAMIFAKPAAAERLPNLQQIQAVDAYFAWRRQQNAAGTPMSAR